MKYFCYIGICSTIRPAGMRRKKEDYFENSTYGYLTKQKVFMVSITGGKRKRGEVKKQEGSLPLVTIITAVFNGRATIEDTIKSVAYQTRANREHIIIDGGSTDGTVETLWKYGDVLDYWVSAPDKGV